MALTAYLRLKSDKPDATGVEIVNAATDTGYILLRDDTDIPTSVAEGIFIESIDSLGAQLAAAKDAAVVLNLALLIPGTSGTDELAMDDLTPLFKECRDTSNYGGRLRYRPTNTAGFVEYEIEQASLVDVRGHEVQDYGRISCVLQIVARPFALGDPYDIVDRFSQNTFGTAGQYNAGGSDWTLRVGSNTPSVSGGILTTSATTGTTIWNHTGTGHSLSDAQGTCKIRLDTTADNNKGGGVVLRYIDSANYIRCWANSNGAGAGTLFAQVITTVGGTDTTSTAITTLAANTWYWVRGRVEGGVVYVEWWTTEPTPMGTPTHSTSAVIAADASAVGPGVKGERGLMYTTVANTISFDDVKHLGHAYRNRRLPEVIRMHGSVVGDVEARADLSATVNGPTSPDFALFAWMPRARTHNFINNATADGDTSQGTSGWSVTAVAGVAGTATSIGLAAGYENLGFEIVCPATSDTGATFALYQRFKRGQTYTVRMYAYSAAGTTVVRCKLGVSGDIATSSSVALSTTWTLHSTTWTPTADVDVAYFAATIGAATATTWRIDNVAVYVDEGDGGMLLSDGGHAPFGVINGASADQSCTTDSYFSISTDADYRCGFDFAGTDDMTAPTAAEWLLLPHVVTPDDYARGEYAVKLFARIEMASTQADVRIVPSIVHEGNDDSQTRRYTIEYGSTGVAIPSPSAGTTFQNVFLGTVLMRVDQREPTRTRLNLECSNDAASTGAFGIDTIIMVPARRSMHTIYGVDDSDAASFIPAATERTKRIKWSKRAEIATETSEISRAFVPDGGLGGANLLLPVDDVDVFAWISDELPSYPDPTTTDANEYMDATIQLAVTPQYALGRS